MPTVDPPGTDGYEQLYHATTGAHEAVAGDSTRTGLSGGENAVNLEAYEFAYVRPGAGTAPVSISFAGNDVVMGADLNASAQAIVFIAPYGQLNRHPLTLVAGDQGGTTAASVATIALVDRTSSLPTGTPASLDFSAGVTEDQTGPAPEPEAWILMLAGMGIAGAGLRHGRRPVGARTRAWPSGDVVLQAAPAGRGVRDGPSGRPVRSH